MCITKDQQPATQRGSIGRTVARSLPGANAPEPAHNQDASGSSGANTPAPQLPADKQAELLQRKQEAQARADAQGHAEALRGFNLAVGNVISWLALLAKKPDAAAEFAADYDAPALALTADDLKGAALFITHAAGG